MMSTERIDLELEAARILEVIAAGVEARCYVRGGMDPLFDDPDARDRYARGLAKHSPSCAAAFLRGWSEHHETVPTPVVWHRFLSGVRWEVAAA